MKMRRSMTKKLIVAAFIVLTLASFILGFVDFRAQFKEINIFSMQEDFTLTDLSGGQYLIRGKVKNDSSQKQAVMLLKVTLYSTEYNLNEDPIDISFKTLSVNPDETLQIEETVTVKNKEVHFDRFSSVEIYRSFSGNHSSQVLVGESYESVNKLPYVFFSLTVIFAGLAVYATIQLIRSPKKRVHHKHHHHHHHDDDQHEHHHHHHHHHSEAEKDSSTVSE